MGLFDYVEGKFKCPHCGAINEEFQTKSFGCMMETIDFRMCDYFYTTCHSCKSWLDVSLNEEAAKKYMKFREGLTVEDFQVDCRTKEEDDICLID